MNILIVSGGIPNHDNPLAGIFSFDQALALKDAGHTVVYLAIDMRSIRRKRKMGIYTERHNGIQCGIISVPIGRVSRRLLISVGSLLTTFFYKTLFSDFRPDIIHAHFGEIGYIATALSEKIKVPLVITEHSSGMNKVDVDSDVLAVSRKGYEAADGVIAVSTALSNNIKRTTGIDSVVIPNIVDLKAFAGSERKQHDGFVFVSVSNLIKLKHIDDLVRAFAVVNKTFPETKLCIIGDGNERKAIKRLVTDYHLEDSVTMTGRLDRTEIAEIFAETDCFVLPSESETFGVAYIEAMAAGLPVIATKCGGPEDFIIPQVGYMVEKNCIDQLIDAMKSMYKNRSAFDEVYIRRYAGSLFSPDTVAGRLTDYYNEILTGHY